MNILILTLHHTYARLAKFLPPGCRMDIDGIGTTYPNIWVFGFPTYEAGSDWLRTLGASRRDKQPREDGSCCVTATLDGIKFTACCASLPPTCHKETYIEKVPKTQTVDTGEFLEVTKTRIVCDGGQE